MFNILIIDDERLARVELKRLLKPFDSINVVAEAKNAAQAKELLQANDIDLVFLDIQMPEVTGLALAAELPSDLPIIFCTAFNEHAVDAFSLNALDYLVKPVNPERLQQAIHKFIQLNTKKTEPTLTTNYLPDNHGILLKFGDCSKIVRLQEIERFESIGNHVAVYSSDGKAYIHTSLSKIEARLDPSVFFKASRSDILRVDSIQKIEDGMATGSLLAQLTSGQQIEVSRRQAQQLKQLFNVW
jgi:two-component system LytT family response regulator